LWRGAGKRPASIAAIDSCETGFPAPVLIKDHFDPVVQPDFTVGGSIKPGMAFMDDQTDIRDHVI
jgi:hypothetical protein